MKASTRSLRALDWLNIFLADIRYGIGPFLAIYLLTGLKWTPGEIGFAMSIAGITAIVFQSPAGALVDATKHKRLLVIIACILVGMSSIAMVLFTDKLSILIIQFVVGITTTIYTPAVTAITMGLVGNEAFPKRMGRNHTFNHTGNVCITLLAGALGYFISYNWIFYAMALMCVLSIFATLVIREKEIDHQVAREARKEGGENGVASISSVLLDRRIIVFTLAVVIFYFANGAMLPMLSQILAKGHEQTAPLYTAGGITIAELVMIPVAAFTGWAASRGKRKYLFLIAFIVLPIRGILYTLTNDPYLLLAIQSLDGLAAGIAGVITIIMVADLTRGTGRFNLMQGAMVTAIEVGEALSHYSTGLIADKYGYNNAFLFLAFTALLGMMFFLLFVPETRNIRQEELR